MLNKNHWLSLSLLNCNNRMWWNGLDNVEIYHELPVLSTQNFGSFFPLQIAHNWISLEISPCIWKSLIVIFLTTKVTKTVLHKMLKKSYICYQQHTCYIYIAILNFKSSIVQFNWWFIRKIPFLINQWIQVHYITFSKR